MMLRRLVEYAERLDRQGELPPRMYGPTRIRWLIDLSRAGELQGFVCTASDANEGPARRGKEYLAPQIRRGSDVRAKLLADRAEYALGLVHTGANMPMAARRTVAAHAAFVALVRKCAKATGEPDICAVSTFLKQLDLASLSLPEELSAQDVVTFRIAETLPIELPSVRSFWAAACEPKGKKEELRYCIVCGRLRVPAERHPVPIKGVPHGRTTGMQIVSAAEDAYESYGLSASLVVPICAECAEHYAQAANALLRSRDTRLVVGPLVYLLWTSGGQGFSAARLLSDPDPGDVRELIMSVDRRRETGVSDAGQFYCAALAASGGRIAVRDWTETTMSAVERSMARYFRLQRMATSDGADEPPWGVFSLAAATAREAKGIEVQTVDALLRVALYGGRVPPGLLYQALRRAKAGQNLTRPQAALIKMALASWVSDVEGERMRELDSERDDPAYLCGRLLAVLERAQASATSAKATIGDRFYGFASTAPLAVFPRLLRGGQNHLAKLRRGKPGAHAHIQRQLKEILGLLPEFPAVLDLADQGLFALGYYHQRVANWRRADAPEPGTEERLPVGPLDQPTL